jgi:hypothetical protein
MEHPDFGDVLKIGKWFFQVLNVSWVPQEFIQKLKF